MIEKYSNNKVDAYQYFALVVFLSRSMFTGMGAQNMVEMSRNDTWVSLLIGFCIGMPLVLLICYINSKEINMFELINKYFSKVISKIINFIIVLVLIFVLVIILNDFINFSNIKYLFETPNIFITILFIFPILFIIKKGPEVIGRTALFLFFLTSVIIFLNSVGLIKYVNFDNLKPVFSTNIFSLFKSSLYYIAYAITPVIFLSIIPKEKNHAKKYNKALIIGYIFSFVATFIAIFYVTTLFNVEYVTLFNYPTYFALKKIKYGFISNAENILSFYFIVDYFFTILVFLYSIFYYLSTELKLREKSLKITSILITTIIVLITNYAYKSTTIAQIVSKTPYIIVSLLFICSYLLLVTLKIKFCKKH